MRRLIGLLAAALLVVGMLAPAAAAAKGGNSAAAHVCQKGGHADWVREDATGFANAGQCVKYAAQGGTLSKDTDGDGVIDASDDDDDNDGDSDTDEAACGSDPLDPDDVCPTVDKGVPLDLDNYSHHGLTSVSVDASDPSKPVFHIVLPSEQRVQNVYGTSAPSCPRCSPTILDLQFEQPALYGSTELTVFYDCEIAAERSGSGDLYVLDIYPQIAGVGSRTGPLYECP